MKVVATTDHLRVCGADLAQPDLRAPQQGSSPRVRSRHRARIRRRRGGRIISACAEQTLMLNSVSALIGDHLRVCGADLQVVRCHVERLGSSPRVRSRLRRIHRHQLQERIISACAEQTSGCRRCWSSTRDHLRVCGADATVSALHRRTLGSSPRVRSRHGLGRRRTSLRGIISACAEQTSTTGLRCAAPADHLRVCGADGLLGIHSPSRVGSSPRVRSRLPDLDTDLAGLGIISACAEQTPAGTAAWTATWDHLRVCGADYINTTTINGLLGSSPRVRSRPDTVHHIPNTVGIISACAEQTGFRVSAYSG